MRSNFHRQEAVNAAYGRLYDPAREVEWTAIQTENPTHSHQSPQHQASRAAFCAAQRRPA